MNSSEIVDRRPRTDSGSVRCHAARNGKCVSCFRPEFVFSRHRAGAPAISVAETKDAFEVTAELPGVDENDIKVSLDGNQLVISGEKRRRARKKKRTGMSRSGASARSPDRCPCQFEPEAGAVDASFRRGWCSASRSRTPRRPYRPAKTIGAQDGHRYCCTEENRLILNESPQETTRDRSFSSGLRILYSPFFDPAKKFRCRQCLRRLSGSHDDPFRRQIARDHGDERWTHAPAEGRSPCQVPTLTSGRRKEVQIAEAPLAHPVPDDAGSISSEVELTG